MSYVVGFSPTTLFICWTSAYFFAIPKLSKRKRLLQELRGKAAETRRENKRQKIEENIEVGTPPGPLIAPCRVTSPKPLPSTLHSPPPLTTVAASSEDKAEESLLSI